MLIIGGNANLKKAIRDAVSEVNQDAEKAIDLKRKIAAMEVEQAKKAEEWARREREVEHKIGLERKRQEFEITQSKRETTVEVREQNLAADKERFKAEMDFQRKHLEGEISSLRELVNEMMKRLPSAEIYASFGAKEK
jgi:hypothetical protein